MRPAMDHVEVLRGLCAKWRDQARHHLECGPNGSIMAEVREHDADDLDAAIASLSAQREAVAEICFGWTLAFCGSQPIAHIVKRHGLKIGDKLYTHPPRSHGVVVDDALVERAVDAFLANTGQAHKVSELQRELTTTCMRAALVAALGEGE